ncbi:hypothetical protein MesoLj131b_32450 [Mesorhizobium sp. 131-2-5]|uniref:hypothetical protein n=1 Tax=Mesorhizobium sp. 131-2-5 TaxID=2744519 RepID=UPI001926FFF7|nr:hypothetical protein [Mesorhizobium sp. 131-2-5]BCH01246.1 hypothetical protein MesoLj131b_32450 [Mesorhizobium sp. 131-2-5]
METPVVDNDFGHWIYGTVKVLLKAAPDLRANYDSKGQVRDLVDFLRSDRPIGPAEREYLADMLSGYMNKERGKRGAAIPHDRKRQAEAATRMRSKETGETLEVAATTVAGLFGMQPDQLQRYIRRSKRAK